MKDICIENFIIECKADIGKLDRQKKLEEIAKNMVKTSVRFTSANQPFSCLHTSETGSGGRLASATSQVHGRRSHHLELIK